MSVFVSMVAFVVGSVSHAEFHGVSADETKHAWKAQHELVLKIRDDALAKLQECSERIPAEPGPCRVQEALFWIHQAIKAQRRILELEEEALDRPSMGCWQGLRFQRKYKRLMHSHLTLGQLLQERSWLMQEEWRRLYTK